MMKYSSQKRVQSQEMPEVTFILKKMTEGRRISLRQQMMPAQKASRDIMRKQSEIEVQIRKGFENDANFDTTALTTTYNDLQDEFDDIIITKINPIWITWGLKGIEGLQVDGKALAIEEWEEWPSGLVHEAVTAIRAEAELEGLERKNLPSPTTSGEQGAGSQSNLTVFPVNEKVGGEAEIAANTSKNM